MFTELFEEFILSENGITILFYVVPVMVLGLIVLSLVNLIA